MQRDRRVPSRLLRCEVAFGGEERGGEDGAAGGAADGVVRERDEAPVEDRVGAEPADGDGLAVAGVAIEAGLRAGVFFEVVGGRARGGREGRAARLAAELLP